MICRSESLALPLIDSLELNTHANLYLLKQRLSATAKYFSHHKKLFHCNTYKKYVEIMEIQNNKVTVNVKFPVFGPCILS